MPYNKSRNNIQPSPPHGGGGPKYQKDEKKQTNLGSPVTLYKPVIVGYMSVDVEREYRNDLSQLKYLNSIPQGPLYYDLNHNIDKAVKRTTDDNNEKITLLLKFILHHKHELEGLDSERMVFVTYRRTLISVMCNVYTHAPVSIVASLLNNCIYLCSMESPQEVPPRKKCPQQDKFCAWGYKYEQYMLSDSPDKKPNIEKPVLENEEFSLYYCAVLGKHRLFYGAQIDGMLLTEKRVKQVPTTDSWKSNLSFLRNNAYVELKTNREITHRHQLLNYQRYKLLRCWCQCYLADLEGLLVGYRDDEGIIQRVEWFDTPGISKYCKGKWSTQVTINYLDSFLSFVKDSFDSVKAASGDNYDSSKPLTLKFDIDDRQNFSVTNTDDEAHEILPSWYVENMQTMK